MPLYTDDELEQLPEFDDLRKALRSPESVIRFEVRDEKNAAKLARVAELRNLQSLSVSLSDVSQLLPLLGELQDLQNLVLQACRVPEFPESILSLRHLRSLTIGNCELLNLPEEIGSLSKLEELRFTQNDLTRIPASIGQLTRLKTLGFSYNSVESIPDSIGNLQALEWLLLDSNQLQQLPAEVGKLSRLEGLLLNGNELRTLPESICDLKRLESLDLKHNPFESLPVGLVRWVDSGVLTIESKKRSLFMDWNFPLSEKPPRVALADLRRFITPDDPLLESLMTAIQQGGLPAVAPAIVRTARAAVEIEATVPDDYSQQGNSRLGGFPDLQHPELFPKSEGLYWIFLAQFDLADLAPFNHFLPRSGLLSFFVDSTVSLKARVLWHEGDPRELATVRHGGGDEMVDSDDDYTQTPYRVKFTRRFSLPYKAPDEIRDGAMRDAYREFQSSLAGVDHQFNGYTFTQNASPEEQAADELGGQPEEWVTLLQLGWDGEVGFCFWDAGTLTFTLHQEDLRRYDFSRVRVTLETS